MTLVHVACGARGELRVAAALVCWQPCSLFLNGLTAALLGLAPRVWLCCMLDTELSESVAPASCTPPAQAANPPNPKHPKPKQACHVSHSAASSQSGGRQADEQEHKQYELYEQECRYCQCLDDPRARIDASTHRPAGSLRLKVC